MNISIRSPIAQAGLATLMRDAPEGAWLVMIATVFNLLLCFINTRGLISIGNTGVIVTELGILLAGLFVIRGYLPKTAVQTAYLIVAFLIGMRLINSGLDLKILHDLAIMYIFYKLGTLASMRTGNRLLWTVMIIVLAVGIFELLLPVLFGNIFDVWSYYVNKGVIGADTTKLLQSNLFISGNRGSEMSRTFFPGLLGSHRVSSVFLEPDSLGNFAVISFAWCLSTSVGRLRFRALLLLFSATCFILPDSRFASICCLMMLLLRLTLFLQSKFLVFLIPVTILAGLTLAGILNGMPAGHLPAIVNDNLSGRLLFSGRLLAYWNPQQWLALAPSQIYTADTGYAYVINNLGLPLTLFLWAAFAASGSETKAAMMMKMMIAIYLGTGLCVGASVFTIKTAALLWFLYGCANTIPALSRMRAQNPSPIPSQRHAVASRMSYETS